MMKERTVIIVLRRETIDAGNDWTERSASLGSRVEDDTIIKGKDRLGEFVVRRRVAGSKSILGRRYIEGELDVVGVAIEQVDRGDISGRRSGLAGWVSGFVFGETRGHHRQVDHGRSLLREKRRRIATRGFGGFCSDRCAKE